MTDLLRVNPFRRMWIHWAEGLFLVRSWLHACGTDWDEFLSALVRAPYRVTHNRLR